MQTKLFFLLKSNTLAFGSRTISSTEQFAMQKVAKRRNCGTGQCWLLSAHIAGIVEFCTQREQIRLLRTCKTLKAEVRKGPLNTWINPKLDPWYFESCRSAGWSCVQNLHLLSTSSYFWRRFVEEKWSRTAKSATLEVQDPMGFSLSALSNVLVNLRQLTVNALDSTSCLAQDFSPLSGLETLELSYSRGFFNAGSNLLKLNALPPGLRSLSIHGCELGEPVIFPETITALDLVVSFAVHDFASWPSRLLSLTLNFQSDSPGSAPRQPWDIPSLRHLKFSGATNDSIGNFFSTRTRARIEGVSLGEPWDKDDLEGFATLQSLTLASSASLRFPSSFAQTVTRLSLRDTPGSDDDDEGCSAVVNTMAQILQDCAWSKLRHLQIVSRETPPLAMIPRLPDLETLYYNGPIFFDPDQFLDPRLKRLEVHAYGHSEQQKPSVEAMQRFLNSVSPDAVICTPWVCSN